MRKNLIKILSMGLLTMSIGGATFASAAEVTDIGATDGANPVVASNDITVTFNQKDTIQLTLSTNTIDFGDVTGITHSDSHNPSTLVANVKSSLPYDVDINATDNFSNKEDATARQVPISKLGVNIDGGAYSKFAGVNTPINLVSVAPATYTIGDNGQDYQIKFDLDSTVGYKAGNYQAPLTVTATQK